MILVSTLVGINIPLTLCLFWATPPTLPTVQFLSLALYFHYLLFVFPSAISFHCLSVTRIKGELHVHVILSNILRAQSSLAPSPRNDFRERPYRINTEMSLSCVRWTVFHPQLLSLCSLFFFSVTHDQCLPLGLHKNLILILWLWSTLKVVGFQCTSCHIMFWSKSFCCTVKRWMFDVCIISSQEKSTYCISCPSH